MAPTTNGGDKGGMLPRKLQCRGKKHLQIVELKKWLCVVFVKPSSEVASSFRADGLDRSNVSLDSSPWISERSWHRGNSRASIGEEESLPCLWVWMLSWVEGRNEHVVWMRWSPALVLIHFSSLIGLIGSSQGQRSRGGAPGLWLCGKPGNRGMETVGNNKSIWKQLKESWPEGSTSGC